MKRHIVGTHPVVGHLGASLFLPNTCAILRRHIWTRREQVQDMKTTCGLAGGGEVGRYPEISLWKANTSPSSREDPQEIFGHFCQIFGGDSA
jgi:hypothetical protein